MQIPSKTSSECRQVTAGRGVQPQFCVDGYRASKIRYDRCIHYLSTTEKLPLKHARLAPSCTPYSGATRSVLLATRSVLLSRHQGLCPFLVLGTRANLELREVANVVLCKRIGIVDLDSVARQLEATEGVQIHCHSRQHWTIVRVGVFLTGDHVSDVDNDIGTLDDEVEGLENAVGTSGRACIRNRGLAKSTTRRTASRWDSMYVHGLTKIMM